MKTFAALLHPSRLPDAEILPAILARPHPSGSRQPEPFYHDRWRVQGVGSPVTLGEQRHLRAEGTGQGNPLGPVQLQINLSLVPFEDGRRRLYRVFRATGQSRATCLDGDTLVIGFVGTLRCAIPRDDDPPGNRAWLELAWQALPECTGRLVGTTGSGIIRGRSLPGGGYHGQTTGTLFTPHLNGRHPLRTQRGASTAD